MRLTNEMRRQAATQVTQEIYRPRVEKLMMDISIKTTETYKKSLPKDYLAVTEKYRDLFAFTDYISISGISCGCSIGYFEESVYENRKWIKYGSNPLVSFLKAIFDRKYTTKRSYGTQSKTGVYASQSIKLVEKVPSPDNHYSNIKLIDWSEVIPMIKELDKILMETENLFSEIYEFLLQFTTYAKAEAEWPDIERYLTKLVPSSNKKNKGALIKSGRQMKQSINKARTSTIGG